MLVEAKNLHKSYTLKKHEICVLNGAELAVQRGESVAVVGRSGAGKSTLLHILGGLDAPDKGSGVVKVAGIDVYGVSSARRSRLRSQDIGFVFQSYHLLNEMDVFENVVLPAMAVGNKKAGGRALELLDAVGLADRAHHTPLELSGGEQQRVAIARALINEPQIVLADEPTGNLDEETGGMVLDMLYKLTSACGNSLLMVTHNESVADSCDRTLFLENGLLVPGS